MVWRSSSYSRPERARRSSACATQTFVRWESARPDRRSRTEAYGLKRRSKEGKVCRRALDGAGRRCYESSVTVARTLPASPDPAAVDQLVRLAGVGWKDYEAVLAMRGERSVPRVTYLEGVLELMSPSKHHENEKKKLARLFEAWAEESGTPVEGIGSWTLKDETQQRGAEPDECYTIDRVPESEDDRPDLAIEVVWTRGGIDKLEVYSKLGVREVWYYESRTLRFFALRGESYEAVRRSELLPAFDAELVLRCMQEPSQTAAVAALRAAMRAGG
jgi:Uma2 family endonuclease